MPFPHHLRASARFDGWVVNVAALSSMPGWLLVCLSLAALAAAGTTGAYVDRWWRGAVGARPDSWGAGGLQRERLRLAAELHETISHDVSALLLHSAGARAVPAGCDSRVRDALEQITRTSTSCMHELVRQREVLRGLGSPGTDASATDLAAALDMLGRARNRGVRVGLHVTGEPGTLDPSIGHTVYLLLAGRLRQAEQRPTPRLELQLVWQPGSLLLRVKDDGSQVCPDRLLADRVRLLGGELDDEATGDGRLTTLTVPATEARRTTTEPGTSTHVRQRAD